MPTSESAFAASLSALTDVAAQAGVDPAASRAEAVAVAAAVIENSVQHGDRAAATDWAQVAAPDAAGDLAATNRAFFEAAARGRKWRLSPTDTLTGLVLARHELADEYAKALADVAGAAVTLGTPSPEVTTLAIETGAVYTAAAAGRGRPGSAQRSIDVLDPSGPLSGPWPPPAAPSVFTPPDLDGMKARIDATRRSVEGMLGALGLGSGSHPSDPHASGGLPSPPEAEGQEGAGAGSAASTAKGETTTDASEPEEPKEPEKTADELLAELDAMIGLGRVKKEIHRQVALLSVEKMRTEAGLKAPKMSRHLVFVGNPGTGKTTVARLVGAIYKALGLLPKGQLVEVDRGELVAGYVGQTAIKTSEVVAKAIGGVLFIDEAYGLSGDQYAQEAVNTLVKEMEDHREDLVVIVAGYTDPMARFIAQNPGLASRFTTTIEFDDYSDDELMAILLHIAAGSDYELTDEAQDRVRKTLQATPRGPTFGNGRFARNLFEAAVARHAVRLQHAEKPTIEELRTLVEGDFIDAPEPADEPEPEPVGEPEPASETDPAPDPDPVTDPEPEEGTP